MNISVVGTGYVGIVTGTCLAEKGHRVVCVDTRADVVEKINQGVAPIYEMGLQELMENAVATGFLRATTDCESAVLNSDITLICVGTPTGPSGMDLSQVVAVAKTVGATLAKKPTYHVVAVKSTVLPGTTEGIVCSTLEQYSGRQLGDGWGLCMNPEFLREGHAVEDFLRPDRVVVGASDDKAAALLLRVYEGFGCPKVVTRPRTAEMIKYASNALFATLISYSNEVANICAAMQGIDARDVWKGVHLDRRLTPVSGTAGGSAGVVEYLWHGLGFGGSCFPKDVAALREFGTRLGKPTPILDAVLKTNSLQPLQVVTLLEGEMDLAGKRIAVLGLAFKPGTDDLRESPALAIVEALRARSARVVVHDPIAMPVARHHVVFHGAEFAADWQSAVKNADACCVVTSWPEYKAIDLRLLAELMRQPVIIDGRGLYNPSSCAEAGVRWRGVGYMPMESFGSNAVVG